MILKTIPHPKPNLFKRLLFWFKQPKLNPNSIETITIKPTMGKALIIKKASEND